MLASGFFCFRYCFRADIHRAVVPTPYCSDSYEAEFIGAARLVDKCVQLYPSLFRRISTIIYLFVPFDLAEFKSLALAVCPVWH